MQIALSNPLRWLFAIPTLLLICVGLLVPSDGQHGVLQAKSLAYIFASISLFLHFLTIRSVSPSIWKIITFTLVSVMVLGVWLSMGIINHPQEIQFPLDQVKLVWLTITAALFMIYTVETKLLCFRDLLKVIICANFLYSSLKIVLVLLGLLGFIDIDTLIELAGISVMRMEILGDLSRLQTSVDVVTPFLLFFCFQSRQFGIHWTKGFKIIYCSVAAVAIFLSFSRYLMAVALVSWLLHRFSGSLFGILRALIVFLLVAIAAIPVIGFENCANIVEKRFFSQANRMSDQVRVRQIEALTQEYLLYPVFGKGLGAYAPTYFRHPDKKYFYEVQWSVLTLQLGIVGLCLLWLPLIRIYLNFFSSPITRQKVSYAVMLTLWLLSGFTNPLLLSVASAIMYALFYLSGKELLRQNRLVTVHSA